MTRLISFCRRSRIESIPEKLGTIIDAQEYMLRITFNGITKTVSGSTFPALDRPLLHLLLHAYKDANLTRVDSVSIEN